MKLFGWRLVAAGAIVATSLGGSAAHAASVGEPARISQAGPYVPTATAVSAVGASIGARRQVAWTTGGRLFLQRLTADGAMDGSPVLVAAMPQTSARSWVEWGNEISLSIGGGRSLISLPEYYESGVGYGHHVSRMFLVDVDNTVVEVGHACGTSRGPTDAPPPATSAWNGSVFLVAAACGEGNDLPPGLEVSSVSVDGEMTERGRVSGVFSNVALASAGGAFTAVFHRVGPFNDLDIGAQRFTSTGAALGSPITVATGSGDQVTPSVAASGGQYLVAWAQPGTGTDIAGRTLSTAGSLGTRKVFINASGNQLRPSLALAASGAWHATWTDLRSGNNDVYGTQISKSLVSSVANGRLIAGGPGAQRAPVVAPVLNGQAFVTYLDGNSARTLLLSSATAGSGPPKPASFEETVQWCESLAAGDGQSLAVWTETRPGSGANIYGQRISTSGSRIGLTFAIGQTAGDQSCPKAAFGGSGWLVAWTETRSSPAEADVYGAMVSGTGAVAPSGGFPIATAAKAQSKPAVGFDGANFVVAWTDERNQSKDVYAARVRPNRTLLDGSGFAVATGNTPQSVTSVTGGTNTSLIAWDVYESSYFGRVLGRDRSFRGVARQLPQAGDYGSLALTHTSLGYTAVTTDGYAFTGFAIGEGTGSPTTTHDFGFAWSETISGPMLASYDGSQLRVFYGVSGEYGSYWEMIDIDPSNPGGEHPAAWAPWSPTAVVPAGPGQSTILTRVYPFESRLSAAPVA